VQLSPRRLVGGLKCNLRIPTPIIERYRPTFYVPGAQQRIPTNPLRGLLQTELLLRNLNNLMQYVRGSFADNLTA
jgi:hypothetical protein